MKIEASSNYNTAHLLKLSVGNPYNKGMKYEQTEIKLLKIRQCLKDRLASLKGALEAVSLKEYRQTLIEYWVVEDLLEEHRSIGLLRNIRLR